MTKPTSRSSPTGQRLRAPARAVRLGLFALMPVLAFGAGAWVAIVRGWGAQEVRVNVVNASGKTVRSLVLEYDSCGHKGLLDARTLGTGEQALIRYAACGESGYVLRVEFEDGGTLLGTPGYAESRYQVTEVIEAQRIRPDVRPGRL